MILMNYQCAKKMVEYKCGLFRSVTAIHRDIPEDLPGDISKFLKYWGSSGGVYEKYNEETAMKKHEILRFDSCNSLYQNCFLNYIFLYFLLYC